MDKLQVGLWVVLLTVISEVVCKTSFVKDLKTDVEFPPANVHTVAGIPEGHLRPLGRYLFCLEIEIIHLYNTKLLYTALCFRSFRFITDRVRYQHIHLFFHCK